MNPFHSIRLAAAYTLCLATVISLSCSRPKEDPILPVPKAVVETARDSVAVAPTLLSVKIDGIPDGNIRIDNAQRVIYIRVPTDVATVTPTVELVASAGGRVDAPTRIVLGKTFVPIVITYTRTFTVLGAQVSPNRTEQIVYTVRSIPVGELALPTNANADIGQTIFLPVQNFYDSLSSSVLVKLTAVSDGRMYTGQGGTQSTLDSPVIPVGTVAVTLTEIAPPGDYLVELNKDNFAGVTRTLRGGRLTLIAGRPALSLSYSNRVLTERGLITLTGYNLYGNQPLTVELVSVECVRFALKPVYYAPDGSQLRIDLPADVPAGYYLARILREGQLINTARLQLSPNKLTIRLLQIGRTDITQPSDKPISVDRATPLSVTVSLTNGPVQIRLVDATDSRKIYTKNMAFTWSSFCFECGRLALNPVSLADVPPGRYLISVSVGDPVTNNDNLGNLERLIDLQ